MKTTYDKWMLEHYPHSDDREASIKHVESLRDNRSAGDIPLTDSYWLAVAKHRYHHEQKQ